MDYTEIKGLAKEQGVKVTDLIALAPSNDPFYVGTPSDWILGRWFAGLWHKFGYTSGVHIRRVHYQIISQNPPVMLPHPLFKESRLKKGEPLGITDPSLIDLPYENTETCWDIINQASKMARYLGLVEPSAFVDRRNPDPHVFTTDALPPPSLFIDKGLWGLPALPDFPPRPAFWVSDYQGTQMYHIEVWCEKSTMNDVLIPWCQRYGANLVTGLGEMSITAVKSLAERFTNRPVRVFYVSDFDPAGQSIPCSVARKVEYFQRNKGFDADVKIFPVVLNEHQVRRYRLPRTPIKESEKRGAKFEDRYGSGAVELDALEALHPGVLESILTDAVGEYYDATLANRVEDAKDDLQAELTLIETQVTNTFAPEIKALEAEYAQLKAEFGLKFGGYGSRLTTLWDKIALELGQQRPDLDNHPIPEADEADEADDALYDSSRNYYNQLGFYKQFQGKT